MLKGLKEQWRSLTRGRPGRRFQDRYQARKRSRPHPAMKCAYLALGALVFVFGLVMLPAPGPGAPIVLIGATIVAQESLLAARACDALELKARALIRRARRRWRRA